MHLFIEKYIASSNFPYLEWNLYLSKDNLLESAILNLYSVLNNVEEKAELNEDEIDKALIAGHEDADIFMLFISISIICLSQRSQLEKAKSLVSIGDNLLASKLQPAIHAVYLQAYSRLKYYCRELSEEKRLMAEALGLLKKDDPRYRANLTNYSYMLARYGMLNDLDATDFRILKSDLENSKEKKSLVYEILMANCIMQGDSEKALEFLNLYLLGYDSVINSRYENAFFSINILSGNRDFSFCKNVEFKDIASVVEDFYENRWGVIPDKLVLIKAIEFQNPFIHFVTKYLPLHFELIEKYVGKAKFILQENRKLGKDHFLDDLFYVRIALLENKKREALFYAKRLKTNVSKYNFEKRVGFELQFAKEMSASDLHLMFQKAEEYDEKSLPLEESLPEQIENNHKGMDLIVGKSAIIIKVKTLIQKFSVILEPVLITGETGTGKELVAQALHDVGTHAKEPFLAINCGALTDTLLQSELFGYEAGAFTGAQKEKKGIFEAAGRGTVFLDEFEDVSQKMQSSLLRVLETNEIRLIGGNKTRKINCKIVVATNVSLKSLVSKKLFREDLYFRLARFEINLPALRERKEDIPELIQHFLVQQNKNDSAPSLGMDLLSKLTVYEWPGNIRELKNAIDRMKILHSDKNIFGLDEFEFDQLESFSTESIPEKSPAFIQTPELALEGKEEEEELRVKKIIEKGFKIESRVQYLKEIFIKYKKMSRSQVVEILKVSPLTAANTLQALCEEGLIVKRMPSKSTKSHYYELKD